MDSDIYVLANNREKRVILKILDIYLPERFYGSVSNDNKLEFWDDKNEKDNQGKILFTSEYELFDFMEKNTDTLFRPTFYPLHQSEVRLVQLYYFEDGSLVFGININQNSKKEDETLDSLKRYLESDFGYISYHISPAHGREAFVKQCKELNIE